MSVVKENLDAVNAVLKIQITPEDYQDSLNTELKKIQKQATLKGFRPGKVPMGLVKRMHSSRLILQELDKVIQEQMSNYLTESKLPLIGQPMQSLKHQKEHNFETDTEFEFAFDIGLMQELDIPLDEIEVPRYKIIISDETIEKNVESLSKQLGSNKETDIIDDESAIITASFSEIDEAGVEIKDGIKSTEARLLISTIKDEAVKKNFMGRNKSEIIEVDMKKAFPSDVEISSLLKIDKEKVSDITNRFNLTIDKIEKMANADLDENLFTKIYGEMVKSVDDFREKVKEDLVREYEKSSDYKLLIDTKKILNAKYDPEFPEEFFKRWIVSTQKMKKEDIEKHFNDYVAELKQEVLKYNLDKKYDIPVEREDVELLAESLIKQQVMSTGMDEPSESDLKKYIDTLLKDDQQNKRLYDTVYDEKLMVVIRANGKFDEKEITSHEFDLLLQNKTETDSAKKESETPTE